MMRMAVMAALIGCILPCQAAAPARAHEARVSIGWSLTPSAIAGSGTLDLRETTILPLGTASPRHVFRLEEDVQLESGKIFIPRGIELAWANGAHQVACEPFRVEKHVYFRCLLDSDGDGTLDIALVASNVDDDHRGHLEIYQYLMGTFQAIEPVGRVSLKQPIPISAIAEVPSQLKVATYLTAGADGDSMKVALCASREGYESVCTETRSVPLNGATAAVDRFGLHLVANVTPNGPATITATPASNDIAF